MTNEERFEGILNEIHFELRKGEDNRYFLYDAQMGKFYPCEDIEENNLAVKPDENGIYHIIYDGSDKRMDLLFNSDDPAIDRDALEEELDIGVYELYSEMTESSASDIIETLDTFVGDSYLDDINDVCSVNLDNFDEAFELEEQLLAQADNGDKEAISKLENLGETFNNMHFIDSADIDKVDLNKVYDLQETRKRQAVIGKSHSDIERD